MATAKKYKKISIIIPVYNEEKTIREVIKRVNSASYLGLKKEIIVVDDHSKDKTAKILKWIKSPRTTTIYHKENMGKGAAMRSGFAKVSGDIIVIQDADFEYNPDEIKLLLEPIINKDADVVYGSRFTTNKPRRVLYFWHSMANQFLTLLSNAFTNLNLTDMETGYKAFTNDVIKKVSTKLTSDRFGFEPEITSLIANLAKKGEIKIYEVGISYHGRTYEEGKKINWKDGLAAIWYIFKFNLFSKHD